MLATGHSSVRRDRRGQGGRRADRHVRLHRRRAARGSQSSTTDHPDVHIVCAAVDRALNERGFIVPGPRRRGRPALRHEVRWAMNVVASRETSVLHHSVLHVLADHLQVVWGALLAFVIVVLLTPAVGGMARRFGVVDSPGGRRLNLRPDPAARRDRALLRDLRPGARVRASRPRDARAADRRRGRGHRRRDRRLPRAALVREARRPDPRGGDPRRLRHLGRAASPSRSSGSTMLPVWVGAPLTVIWIVAIMNMFNFLDGMDGLAAGVAAIAGLTFSVIALSLAKPDAAVDLGDRLRRLPRLHAPQLLSGADLHGRLGRAAARLRRSPPSPCRAC